jgi:hypothetical protein
MQDDADRRGQVMRKPGDPDVEIVDPSSRGADDDGSVTGMPAARLPGDTRDSPSIPGSQIEERASCAAPGPCPTLALL